VEMFFSAETLIALVTLTFIEIVLGIDNIIFISILAEKLPPEKRNSARIVGLAAAMISRIILLLFLTTIMRLTKPWFSVLGNEISGRDLVLISGGIFLLVKSTLEIHDNLEGMSEKKSGRGYGTFTGVIIQIMVLDIVFSLDSIITAIGLVDQVSVMIIAIIIAIIIMMISSGSIARFIESHPTIKMLALSFLLLIGFALVAEGFDLHIPKGYIYFAIAFSCFVEMLNLRIHNRSVDPVILRKHILPDKDDKE